jgi:hypothetical protein
MVTVSELAKEIQVMRALQKNYFATRNKSVLQESKEQEKKVDRLISEVLFQSKQLDLLGGE